jgi:hypothetical protein
MTPPWESYIYPWVASIFSTTFKKRKGGKVMSQKDTEPTKKEPKIEALKGPVS